MTVLPLCRVGFAFVVFFLALIAAPASASAQWFFAAYLGANATRPATVSIDVPSENLSLQYHDVSFEARPFESPQYYGVRGGRLFGAARRFGVEIEWIHLKIYADTEDTYRTSGQFGTALLTDPAVAGGPMSAVVQRYAMSHGLNFLVINIVTRLPLRGPVALVARAGAGPTLPHAETTVLRESRGRYEYAGMGGHAAAGLDARVRGRLSLVGEYKFTYAKPRIGLAAGSGRTTAATHHVSFGLAFGLAR